MQGYQERTYGDLIAEEYDQIYSDLDGPIVEVLADLAGGGRALELGIGTGRVALPLAEAGVQVQGIDASEKMVARLQEKAGDRKIPVTIGSFADFNLDTQFDLIYVVFNTFYGLLSQDDQVRSMQSVARHLKPDGKFLMEAFVPDLGRYERGQSTSVTHLDQDLVRIDASMLSRNEQVVSSQHIFLSLNGVDLYPVKLRFAYPSELDLMARLSGMTLEHRWGSWDREEFGDASGSHISTYRLDQ